VLPWNPPYRFVETRFEGEDAVGVRDASTRNSTRVIDGQASKNIAIPTRNSGPKNVRTFRDTVDDGYNLTVYSRVDLREPFVPGFAFCVRVVLTFHLHQTDISHGVKLSFLRFRRHRADEDLRSVQQRGDE
jgi:hypothetical protein